MTRHLFGIGLTSLAIVVAGMPLAARQGRGDVRPAQEPLRGDARPAQKSGRGVTIRPAQGRVAIAVDENGPRPQAFSVSLVLGEMQASGGADTVPPAARKALTDVKDFLPYKAYRLLDSQWTLCCGRPSRDDSRIVSRLRGPDEQDYALEIVPTNAGNGKYYVHFSLWEPRTGEQAGATAAADEASMIAAQRTDRERRLAELRKSNAEDHPDVVRLRAEIRELEHTLQARREESGRRTLVAVASRRAVIDTSFTMDVGETVVVGTSRLKGDKALIALLTAVAPTKSPAR